MLGGAIVPKQPLSVCVRACVRACACVCVCVCENHVKWLRTLELKPKASVFQFVNQLIGNMCVKQRGGGSALKFQILRGCCVQVRMICRTLMRLGGEGGEILVDEKILRS